jgi:hypothetical protein
MIATRVNTRAPFDCDCHQLLLLLLLLLLIP